MKRSSAFFGRPPMIIDNLRNTKEQTFRGRSGFLNIYIEDFYIISIFAFKVYHGGMNIGANVPILTFRDDCLPAHRQHGFQGAWERSPGKGFPERVLEKASWKRLPDCSRTLIVDNRGLSTKVGIYWNLLANYWH